MSYFGDERDQFRVKNLPHGFVLSKDNINPILCRKSKNTLCQPNTDNSYQATYDDQIIVVKGETIPNTPPITCPHCRNSIQ